MTFSDDSTEPDPQQQRNGSLAEVPEEVETETQVTCNGGLLSPPEVNSSRLPQAGNDSCYDPTAQRDDDDTTGSADGVVRHSVSETEQGQTGEVTIRIDEV